MLLLLYYIFLLWLTNQFSCDSGIRQFYMIPDKTYFQQNMTVILSCETHVVDKSISTLIKKDKNMYSEGCRVFDEQKYDMKCLEKIKDGKKFIEFQFKIKKLDWSHRGTWKCFYATAKKTVSVNITVPASFEALQIMPIKPVEMKTENLGPSFSPIDSKGNLVLRGRGSRTNPYNLRSGIALKINCYSSCSFPKINHTWSYANISHGPIDIEVENQTERNICTLPKNIGMYSFQSEAVINCTALKMVGANEIVCRSAESNKTSVYVLCPGGERPWELTSGELIGLAVSVGIIILLIVLLCLMVRRSRSDYHTPADVSTNTYSSGIKV